jgi:hypothetical protein
MPLNLAALRDKASALLSLHRPGNPLVLVNAWTPPARDFSSVPAPRRRDDQRRHRIAWGYPDGERSRATGCSKRSPDLRAVTVPVTADVEAEGAIARGRPAHRHRRPRSRRRRL